jgi:hypothetical protein
MLKASSLVYVTGTGPRDNQGRYKWVEIRVIDKTGAERDFRLRGAQASAKRLEEITGTAKEKGAVLSPAPSLDIRRLGQVRTIEEEHEEAELEHYRSIAAAEAAERDDREELDELEREEFDQSLEDEFPF